MLQYKRGRMRHGIAFRRLGRDSEHRRALLRNLTAALIKHERIRTTVAKAKELRRPAERVWNDCKFLLSRAIYYG